MIDVSFRLGRDHLFHQITIHVVDVGTVGGTIYGEYDKTNSLCASILLYKQQLYNNETLFSVFASATSSYKFQLSPPVLCFVKVHPW